MLGDLMMVEDFIKLLQSSEEIQENPPDLVLISSSFLTSWGRVFHGHITKQGNKWLRWAMVEAVWPAIRKDAELRRYYEKLKIKKGANCAKVSTTKRLLTIVYRVLKEKRYYEVHRLP